MGCSLASPGNIAQGTCRHRRHGRKPFRAGPHVHLSQRSEFWTPWPRDRSRRHRSQRGAAVGPRDRRGREQPQSAGNPANLAGGSPRQSALPAGNGTQSAVSVLSFGSQPHERPRETPAEAKAEDARTAAVQILEKLVADVPGNPDYRHELAETYVLLYPRSYDSAVSRGDITQLNRAIEIGTELVARYPAVPEYTRSLASSHARFAEAMQQADDWEEAQRHLLQAIALKRSLVAEFPAISSYRSSLARSFERLAKAQLERQQLPEARANIAEAIATLDGMKPSAGKPSSSHRSPAFQYAGLVKMLRQMGEDALADEVSTRAEEFGAQSEMPFVSEHFYHHHGLRQTE